MIISHGRRFIFVHIPKTGGTSMALALEARAMKDDIMLGDTPKALKRRKHVQDVESHGRLWKHSTLADIDGLVSEQDLDNLFCFTLVRNPWDRLVSYYHWLRTQRFEHPARHLAAQLSFADFVCHPTVANSFRHTPARSYMTDVRGIHRCNAYIRIEHLEEDLRPVEEFLGFKLALGHTNRSERAADWREYYTDAAAESVAQTCAEDIMAFKYTLDG